MKRKEEETVTPDSANISDMQTNDDEDERTESRERSKGKRRTAREIANMFEQLKQRHIARKQEWQKEKEDLVKKVETADESKKILADLKFVLENLRKELRLEEKKRLEMEKNYQDEKFSWLSEKDYLLQRIEESTIESEEGAEVSALTEKICEQSRELSILQDDLLQLKKSLLEKENVFLREKRELEIQLEKERVAWKQKESSLTERIKLLDSKSGISSASSPLISPAATPHPPYSEVGNNGKYLRRKSSAVSIGQETSEKYNTFQQTVDDALKQIDKISKDLNQIEEPRPGRSLTPLQASQLFLPESKSSTPSPRRISSTLVDQKTSTTHDPSVNAPWRSKRRTSSAQHSNEGNQSMVHPETMVQSQDKDTLQPVANKAQVKIIPDSRSPIPDRKVKKIDRQGSKVDVILSSPDANHSDTSRDFVPIPRLQNIPDAEQPSDTSSNPDFASTALINDPTRRHNLIPRDDTVKRFSPVPLGKIETEDERQPPVAKIGRSAHLPQDIVPTESLRENDSILGMKNDENVARSNSPRLPKLHQQLLFKRELTKGREEDMQPRPKPSAISGRTSQDNFAQEKESLRSRGRRNLSHDSSEQDKNQAHSPYFNPSFGHIAGSRKNKDIGRTQAAEVQDPSSKGRAKELTKPIQKVSKVKDPTRQHIGGALIGLGTVLIGGDPQDLGGVPPVTQPKPKVYVHKDAQGKIVRVSPEIPLKEQPRKSISPESQAPEKYNSIAGRVGSVGKAGRDWIKKKLSFKEKKDDEMETEGKSRPTTVTPSTGDTHEENKRRGRSKPRGRPSSLLRNGSRRSLNVIDPTSTDESNDSGREEKKRESFLRRNRRKSKKNGDADRKADSPAKSKPKKYTRSKTDTSTEMRQFLSKFKASQGNPKKPSIVKQFERRLLENEVKTLEDDKSKTKQTQDGASLEKQGKAEKSRQSFDEGYSGEDEEDNESVKNVKSICQEKFSLPNIVSTNDNLTQRKPKQGPPVKLKPYYRRSMSDFNALINGTDIARSRDNKKKQPLEEGIEEVVNEFPKISPSQRPGVQEAVEVCGKRGVSSLVDRFSTLSEKGGGEISQIARGSTNRNSLRNQIDDSKWDKDNVPVQRSRSMSYRGQRATNWGNNSQTEMLASSPMNAGKSKYDKSDNNQKSTMGAENAESHSWRERVMSKPLDSESNESLPLNSGSGMASDKPSYLPTPPSEHDSKKISWSANFSEAQNIEKSPKPGRMKMMSEEMRRKADVIEKALLHGPKKVRRYRRADTQPIGRSFSTSEEDSTDSEIDFTSAFRPIKKVSDHSNEEDMHSVIPRVTTKFDKPSKPGRMPSRWAR